MDLPIETEQLARLVAAKVGKTPQEVVREAVEERARAAGLVSERHGARRRMTVERMLAVGAEIAAMPLLDPRSPREIMDDLNAA
jgi:antitoxin VapB